MSSISFWFLTTFTVKKMCYNCSTNFTELFILLYWQTAKYASYCNIRETHFAIQLQITENISDCPALLTSAWSCSINYKKHLIIESGHLRPFPVLLHHSHHLDGPDQQVLVPLTKLGRYWSKINKRKCKRNIRRLYANWLEVSSLLLPSSPPFPSFW